MISHELRCIFVHIPRTAGTSIEQWLCGQDWWRSEPSTKHLLASQARRVHAAHWDEYFTFSLVRDPWERMLSCLHFAEHFGLTVTINDQGRKRLDLTGYVQRFGSPVLLEHDHRFYDRDDLLRPTHRPGTVYGNILDEDLDYIGRMEDLPEVVAVLADELGVDAEFPHERRSVASWQAARTSLMDTEAQQLIESLFAEDIARYGYHPSSDG